MADNPFWALIKELYPMFLWGCAIMAVWRIAMGAWEKLNKQEGAIGEAIKDILAGLFWAHIAIPLVLLINVIMQQIGDKVTKVVETFLIQ